MHIPKVLIRKMLIFRRGIVAAGPWVMNYAYRPDEKGESYE